jgi:glycosyltransferase involved in cell wall biosynthesis
MTIDSRKKIAIISPGSDQVFRGYETNCRRLFESIKKENSEKINIYFFKRKGFKGHNEITSNTPSRNSFFIAALSKLRGTTLYWESFFMALWIFIFCNIQNVNFGLFYVQEPSMARFLMFLRKYMPNNPKIIFAHGVWMEPDLYANFGDLIAETSIENFNNAIKAPRNKDKTILLPHTLPTPNNFLTETEKTNIRQKYGLNDNKIIISVGTIDSNHKRTNYLIEECAQLPSDWTLIVCGRGDQTIINRAHDLLGDRFLNLYLSPQEVGEIYQISNVFVHTALREGFGIVIIEAMSYGLPVICHNAELFKWITKDSSNCIDMSTPGNLFEHLTKDDVVNNLKVFGNKNREIFLDSFSWQTLKSRYLDLLEN